MTYQKIIPKLWLPWALFILAACMVPAQHLQPFSFGDIFGMDKLIHFICHATLIFLYLLGTKIRLGRILDNKQMLLAVIGVIAYGLFIELMQHFLVASRMFDIGDLIANIAGCVTGFLLFRIGFNRLSKVSN